MWTGLLVIKGKLVLHSYKFYKICGVKELLDKDCHIQTLLYRNKNY